jgi:predicted signal transduction protein with EAL and GGDEF domain
LPTHIDFLVFGRERCFGAYTTAEGVETDDQLTRIQAEGCTEVQGYIFSRPLPAAEIPALLARLLPAADLLSMRRETGTD